MWRSRPRTELRGTAWLAALSLPGLAGFREQFVRDPEIGRSPGAHVPEESDHAVVPVNQPNKGDSSSAEVGEGRAWTKENIARSNTSPTQSGERVFQGLSGVRQAAKERRQERFTALLHHMSIGPIPCGPGKPWSAGSVQASFVPTVACSTEAAQSARRDELAAT
jgi:hypothetical protein